MDLGTLPWDNMGVAPFFCMARRLSIPPPAPTGSMGPVPTTTLGDDNELDLSSMSSASMSMDWKIVLGRGSSSSPAIKIVYTAICLMVMMAEDKFRSTRWPWSARVVKAM